MRGLRPLMLSATIAISTAASFVGGLACDAETAFDCDQVCTKYHDCYDASYDIGTCRDKCRAKAANDPTVKAKADACETCIEGMSCLPAAFNCAMDCGVIVP